MANLAADGVGDVLPAFINSLVVSAGAEKNKEAMKKREKKNKKTRQGQQDDIESANAESTGGAFSGLNAGLSAQFAGANATEMQSIQRQLSGMNKLLASYIHTVISYVFKAITTAMDEYGASKVSSAEAALEIAEQARRAAEAAQKFKNQRQLQWMRQLSASGVLAARLMAPIRWIQMMVWI